MLLKDTIFVVSWLLMLIMIPVSGIFLVANVNNDSNFLDY